MTNYVYKSVIQPINRCSLTGLEKTLKSERFGNFKVIITKDNFNQHRAILIDVSNNSTIVCGILFDQFNTVRFKHTIEAYQGQKLSRQLFAMTCSLTKKRFKHSDNLTTAGQASI